MKLKWNVRPFGVRPEITMILPTAEFIWKKHGAPKLVVTSITEGSHVRASQHRDGLAVDLRTKNLPSEAAKQRAVQELKGSLTREYFVDLEGAGTDNEHCHVHFRRR